LLIDLHEKENQDIMTQFSKRERVEAVLKGEPVDRVPVSAWRHFLDEEGLPETLAAVSLKHFQDYDWDWLKVNPRATYYAEAWGNQYDFGDYDSVIPRLIDGPLHGPDDLDKIGALNPTTGVFDEHLRLTRLVRQGIGDAHFLQTVFSPLSVLSFLASRPESNTIEDFSRAQYEGLRRLIHENPKGAHEALSNIASTLGKYAAESLNAGASGIFFAIVKIARQGILNEAEYAEFGKPYDVQVLNAVQEASFNLLHICGPYAYFDSVTDYPVHAINWASVGQHNPSLTEARAKTSVALVGGVDELGSLQTGTPEQVIDEALAAIRASNGHLLLTPGCGTNPDVPGANLHALRRASDLAAETA
jgi:uroporphyrinogen decarboxylase